MKQLLFFLSMMTLIGACKKAPIDLTYSDCIKQKIEDFKVEKPNSRNCFIESAEYRSKVVFIFDYCTAADGIAIVLDNNCDTVGTLCGECFIGDFQRDFGKKAKNMQRIWR
jgi:hypothetical protein